MQRCDARSISQCLHAGMLENPEHSGTEQNGMEPEVVTSTCSKQSMAQSLASSHRCDRVTAFISGKFVYTIVGAVYFLLLKWICGNH